jgi:FtsP/CotA-like multicopper oxidase with cupredoxin domain
MPYPWYAVESVPNCGGRFNRFAARIPRLSRSIAVCLLILVPFSLMLSHSVSHASLPGPRDRQLSPLAPISTSCQRLLAGSTVLDPPALHSDNGVLELGFSYQTTTDADGNTLLCFLTSEGLQNPTLHVRAGDRLKIKVTNNTPSEVGEMTIDPPNCGSSFMTPSAVNIHYHGTNTAPVCGQDEVIRTSINSGQTFLYDVEIPSDEPPGLYWYHPHIHGTVENALQSGASGAIVVEGVQDAQPAVAGLRQRILMIRDQLVAGNLTPGGDIPSWDLSLNFIPIAYPVETPAVLQIGAGEKQLWRVCNASADSLLDLQVVYDGVPQTLQIVGFDGVPAGSQDGRRSGQLVSATHIFLPTAARAEFIVTAPATSVKDARLITLNINTGPDGDNDPIRTIALIRTAASHEESATEAATSRHSERRLGSSSDWPAKQRFEGLWNSPVTASRKLYFSEVVSDPSNPASPTNFYITVDGATPRLFDPNEPPAVVTTQGAVEVWTIENRAQENHEFHMHQIHFLVMSQDNFDVNGTHPNQSVEGQYLDTLQVPYWDGDPNHPYPSVTLRMDFREVVPGDFVYHCHIAGHEDAGMMATIRVQSR